MDFTLLQSATYMHPKDISWRPALAFGISIADRDHLRKIFSRFSNNLGQVLESKLPKEFVIPDDDPSPNRSYDRVFLRIDFGPPLNISIRRERISLAPTGDRNWRKR